MAPLDHEIDRLYQLPLAEFTSARAALAKRRGPDAAAIRKRQKPSVAAWAVNQLYWRHRKEFEQLIATGERFRQAQATHLAGKSTDVRGPLNARREALAALSPLAAQMLRSGGYSTTPDMMRRVTTTLEALATYGSLPDAPRGGRLLDDVDPPGFETLAALVPRVGDAHRGSEGPTRVLPFAQHPPKPSKRKETAAEQAKRREEERQAQVAAAKAAVQEAERELRDAKKTAEQAEAALKKAALRAKEADRQRAELEKRYEKLVADADAAKHEARRVAEDAEEAAQSVEDAERALDKAKRQLEQLV